VSVFWDALANGNVAGFAFAWNVADCAKLSEVIDNDKARILSSSSPTLAVAQVERRHLDWNPARDPDLLEADRGPNPAEAQGQLSAQARCQESEQAEFSFLQSTT
jgi:hypothetical protein